MSDIEEILSVVDNILQPTRLNTIQEIVLRECWSGKTYQEIATESGYDPDYIRVVGSRLWQILSNAFDEKITKNNFRAVFRQQIKSQSNVGNTSLSIPNGQVSLDSPLYIERPPHEVYAYEEIFKPGALIRIKASLNMGKTSLMARILARAQGNSYQTIRINFQLAEASILSDLDKFLRWLAANITRQLHLESEIDEYWDEDLGSKVSCTTYLQGYILGQLTEPLVIAFDEVNRLFEYPDIAGEFLPLLRFWHEESNNFEVWQKLRIVVVHSTDVYIPLNLNQSPFNVGLAIELPEFTPEQIAELAQRHNIAWEDRERDLPALIKLVGGHPYLVRLAFYALATQKISCQQLIAQAGTQTGIFRSYLQSHLITLEKYPELGKAFRQAIASQESVKLPTITAYKLESLGLINLSGDAATPSCELYRLYFKERL